MLLKQKKIMLSEHDPNPRGLSLNPQYTLSINIGATYGE